MIYVQFSAGQGPDECGLAVAHALRYMMKEAQQSGVEVVILESERGRQPYTFKSVIVELQGEQAMRIAQQWEGSIQWICPSPYRVKAERKNWFIGVTLCAPLPTLPASAIRYEVCRSRGPGGQHVNTTNSAVIAIHESTGLRVRAESERSQHANKRVATQLLLLKLAQQEALIGEQQRASQRLAHFKVQRGHPTRVFVGSDFVLSRRRGLIHL